MDKAKKEVCKGYCYPCGKLHNIHLDEKEKIWVLDEHPDKFGMRCPRSNCEPHEFESVME